MSVAELVRRPGNRRELSLRPHFDDLAVASSRVDPASEVEVDLEAESIFGGVVVTGSVGAAWTGECRRCLDPVEGRVDVAVREIFEPHPSDDDILPIADDHIDLEPVVREAVLLSLPLAPLCADDCRGPAPDAFPTVIEGEGGAGSTSEAEGEAGADRPIDPRWAVLDELRFDNGPTDN